MVQKINRFYSFIRKILMQQTVLSIAHPMKFSSSRF